MVPLARTAAAVATAAALAALAACDDLTGFGGEAPPLATFSIAVTGSIEAVRDPDDAGPVRLRAALVWGAQVLPERRCITPAETPEIAEVIAGGCRDPLGFTADRVASSVPVEPGTPAELSLFALPSADVMVGTVTARIAYGSIVVFDDRDDSGTLELFGEGRPAPAGGGPPGGGGGEEPAIDRIYGASFVSMTAPDTRVAFREGGYAVTGFYPRQRCGEPPPAFSVLRAGGFTREAAFIAFAAGALPDQDPASCTEAPAAGATVEVALQPPDPLTDLGCLPITRDGTFEYLPPEEPPDLSARPWACIPVPETSLVELVVASRPDAPCRRLHHYTLRGCDRESRLDCLNPEWDLTASPPAWWPCPAGGVR